MPKSITKSGTLFLLVFLFLTISLVNTYAQRDTTDIWKIKTTDGNEFVGEIVLQTETEMKIKTLTIGTITLQLADIAKIEKVNRKNIRGDEIWVENPHDSRYFFAPSSYGLRKGEAYYQNAWIFFNQLSYGVTDNFSIGAGTVPLFIFAGTSSPVWITPKISIPVTENNFALGGGAFVGTIIGEGEEFGIVYGTSTFGSREKNLTLGLGYGFADGDFADSPAITLSAMVRTGKKGYFITENYLLSTGGDTNGLLSFGGRRLWSNVALDFGGIIPVGDDIGDLVIVPWLGIVFTFSK